MNRTAVWRRLNLNDGDTSANRTRFVPHSLMLQDAINTVRPHCTCIDNTGTRAIHVCDCMFCSVMHGGQCSAFLSDEEAAFAQ